MKILIRLFYFYLLIFAFAFKAGAQGASNKGTDFWFMYGAHVSGYSSSQSNWQKMAIYITSDVNTTGTLEIPGISYSINFSVTANQVTTLTMPQAAYIGGTEDKFNKGIHLKSVKPIVAYGHIYNSSVSGATLLLPTNTLGKEYYSLNFTQKSNSLNAYSFCSIVAVEDNTTVIITPSVPTQGGWPAGIPQTINLNKGQVYQILGLENTRVDLTPKADSRSWYTTGGDLTGTTIKSVAADGQSCKKIAVFSGSSKISIGCLSNSGAPGAADNLFQQVYPTSTWGKSFITIPSKNRNYDIYRVFKSLPTAVVKINGAVIPNTNFVNNLYYEFSSQQTNYIESDNTIQVVQYQVTQGKSINCTTISGDVGDPEMIYLNPLEQTLDKMTMYSSPFYNILRHYINVVIKTPDVASFTLDGVVKASEFRAVPNKVGYSYAQIEVTEGTHNLQANGGFNAIAYGFGTNESYGYAAGASLISPGIEVMDETIGLKRGVGCINERYDLYVSLPYQPLSIKLNLDDGQPTADIPLAPPETYISNNITYYKYKLANQYLFANAKKYLIKVIAEKPISDGCGAVDELELEYDVLDKPIASFGVVDDRICDGVTTTFNDTSQGNGNNIVKWHWDFGDGQAEVKTTADPFTHTYAPGTYNAKLFVENQSGCISPVFSKDITVFELPVAKFITGITLCENSTIQFSDKSTSVDGEIKNWLWDFGDGQTSTASNPEHVYATAGDYEVRLTVTSEYGCSKTFSQTVKINKLPVVDFELPNFCLADGNAVFVNKSSIAGNEPLTYLWNFGDAYANAQRPNTSTQLNGSHIYTQVGLYEISLTVKSANGCTVTVKKEFRVNGSAPRAAFEVENQAALCSDAPVIFRDLATVDFGEITKIEWYFDYANKPTPDIIDVIPALRTATAKKYTFKYPTFSNVASKSYVVKMVVHSGNACVAEIQKTITIKALPQIDFGQPIAVCMEVPSVQLVATEVNNLPGTGIFSGTGVNANGVFKPSVAGMGTHTIKYTFSNGGCTVENTQTITVNETPIIDAGEDLIVLEGNKGVFKTTAFGQNLRYKWSPSTGLDRDDVQNPTVSPTEDMKYTVTVTSDKGCVATDEVRVKLLRNLVIPNSFTPNGDLINDVWNIKFINDYVAAKIEIYDRNGQKVFNSIGYQKPFDGTFNNRDLPVGVYYYIIILPTQNKPITGALTIIR